jgi:hypothetical protein
VKTTGLRITFNASAAKPYTCWYPAKPQIVDILARLADQSACRVAVALWHGGASSGADVWVSAADAASQVAAGALGH